MNIYNDTDSLSFHRKRSTGAFPSSSSNFLPAILCLLSLAGGFLFSKIFSVTAIESSAKLDQASLKPYLNRNILFLNEQRTAEELLKANPLYRDIRVRKELPSKLHLEVLPERPFAQLKNGEVFLILTEGGKVISSQPGTASELPTLTYFQTLRSFETGIGRRLSQTGIRYALKLAGKAKMLPFTIARIDIPTPSRVKIIADGEPLEIVFSTKKRIDKNVIILQNITKSLDIKGVKPKVINLEFDKPIITL